MTTQNIIYHEELFRTCGGGGGTNHEMTFPSTASTRAHPEKHPGPLLCKLTDLEIVRGIHPNIAAPVITAAGLVNEEHPARKRHGEEEVHENDPDPNEPAQRRVPSPRLGRGADGGGAPRGQGENYVQDRVQSRDE